MYSGFLVMDADRHVQEPYDLYDRYLEPPFRGRVKIEGGRRYVDGRHPSDGFAAPRRAGSDSTQRWTFADNPQYREVFAYALAHGFDAESNLHDMDLEGVDVGVHFPTVGLNLVWMDDVDPQLSAAMCRAYNTWLAEYCSYDPVRLKGIAQIPPHDTALAVQELRRAKEELGMVGIFWRPNPLNGRKLDHPDYFPIYDAASELGVPLCIHEGARTTLPQAGNDRYSEFGRHIACHPLEQMLACLTLCADGLLERFPNLKVAHLESGCGWLPFWLERMDEHWERQPHLRATAQSPSFYFKRQCVISSEAGEALVEAVVEQVGAAHLMLATDYPHPDVLETFPEHTVGDLVRKPELTEEVKHQILWDTPARFYGITGIPNSAVPGVVEAAT